jgi:hypothetical protein
VNVRTRRMSKVGRVARRRVAGGGWRCRRDRRGSRDTLASSPCVSLPFQFLLIGLLR